MNKFKVSVSLFAACSLSLIASANSGSTLLNATTQPSPAVDSQPKTWAYDEEKLVAAAFNPTLSINVYKLEVDDNTYARIDVNLAYVSSDMTRQAESISAKYPGYQLQKVILEKSGTFHLTIPVLGFDEDTATTLSQDGPTVSYQQFLTKTQYGKVRAELAAGRSLASVTGTIHGTVPVYRVVEHQEADASICSSVIGSGITVVALSEKLSDISKLVGRTAPFKYDSTREKLVADIQNSCFEIAQSTAVNSYADLLALVLRAKNPGRPLVGETKQKVLELQDIPLSFTTQQKEGN